MFSNELIVIMDNSIGPVKIVRKRRTKQEIAAAAGVVTPTTDIVTEPTVTDVAQPKARGKKKIQPVVAIVTSNGIQGSFGNFSKRPLIAHLDIKSSDVSFFDQPPKYNPDTNELLKEPEPYNVGFDDPFMDTNMVVEDVKAEPVAAGKNVVSGSSTSVSATVTTSSAEKSQHIRREFGAQTLLVSFNSANNHNQTIPEQTDVYCFWCCHGFTGRPCVLPQACIESVWRVYGNFCSPSCGLSYLMNETMDTHIRWERIALLSRLYGGERIYPAPSRECLAVFGGTMTIDEYRTLVDEHKLRVDIQYPPMVSILASMDTKPIDFYETSIKNSFVAAAQERLHKAEEGLKLRRTKPLKDRESTLDSCLNISIRQTGEVF